MATPSFSLTALPQKPLSLPHCWRQARRSGLTSRSQHYGELITINSGSGASASYYLHFVRG
jgi:hypothetical protein